MEGVDNSYSVLMSVYVKEKAEFLRTAMDSIWNQTIPTDDFVLFRTLYAAKTSRNRQIQCTSNLMENDEKRVKIHEAFMNMDIP